MFYAYSLMSGEKSLPQHIIAQGNQSLKEDSKLFPAELFHTPERVISTLELDELFRGTTVLDCGSGQNKTVDALRERGISAVGIDFKEKGGLQDPSVVGATTELPFKDKSFDVVINFWGGLTYPLLNLEVSKSPEERRQILLVFLHELREAFRVARKEVSIHPWGLQPITQLTGSLFLHDGFAGEHTMVVLVDFLDLFRQMNVEVKMGKLQTANGSFEQANGTVQLDVEHISLSPLDDLIKKIEQSDQPLVISTSENKELGKLARDGIWRTLTGLVQHNELNQEKLHQAEKLEKQGLEIPIDLTLFGHEKTDLSQWLAKHLEYARAYQKSHEEEEITLLKFHIQMNEFFLNKIQSSQDFHNLVAKTKTVLERLRRPKRRPLSFLNKAFGFGK